MNRASLRRLTSWRFFAVGVAFGTALVFYWRSVFLIAASINNTAHFAHNAIVLFLAVLVWRLEPRIWTRERAEETRLRWRLLFDLLPWLIAFLLRDVFSLSSSLLTYWFAVAVGLRAVTVWATRPFDEKKSFWHMLPAVVVWAVLLWIARRQPLFILSAILLSVVGLVFLREQARRWLRTESVAVIPGVAPLIIAAFPTTSNWWLSTAAIAIGAGRLWAYSRWRERSGYGLFMLSACLAAGLLVEGALRISPDASSFETMHFAPTVVSHDKLFWVNKEVFRGDSDFGVGRVKIRGREVPKQKTPGVQRVMCCGGSSTFGVNLPPEQAWPAIAEQVLHGNGCTVELLNAGEPGYTIFQIKMLLEYYLLPDYHPDGVILYVGYNDSRLMRGPYSERELWQMWQKARAGQGGASLRVAEVLQHSRAYNLFARLLVGARQQAGPKKAISSPPEFSATLGEMLAMLQQKQVRTLVAAEAYQEPDQIYRQIMKRQAADHGAGFVDVYDLIRKRYDSAAVHTDVVHLTPEGNRHVAELIASAWRQMMQEEGLCRP